MLDSNGPAQNIGILESCKWNGFGIQETDSWTCWFLIGLWTGARGKVESAGFNCIDVEL